MGNHYYKSTGKNIHDNSLLKLRKINVRNINAMYVLKYLLVLFNIKVRDIIFVSLTMCA